MQKKSVRGRESREAYVPLLTDAESAGDAGDEEEPEAAGILLGRRVTQIRTQRRLSQRELDRLGDFGHGWVSSLEAGHLKNPGIDSIYKLATALGVSVVRLLVDSTEDLSGGQGSAGTNTELQELYSSIQAIWQMDPGRIAALQVLVRDMQEQAALERIQPQHKAPKST